MVAALRPLFRYFGSKWSHVGLYPKPTHDLIVEPFAGGAAYACHYYERDVVLCDAYPTVARLWQWLTRVDPDEIRALPLLTPGDVIPDDVQGPARDLIGFWCVMSGAHPQNKLSRNAALTPSSFWSASIRERIARAVLMIRHWRVCECSFADLPNAKATWFVDPPYQVAGRHYFGHRDIDYARLGAWCRDRTGQVIVCENEGASWLPFSTVGQWHSATKERSRALKMEVAWIRQS
jgi:site-specific DNA-adenine methylase